MFNLEQLGRHAKSLAAGDRVTTRKGANRLLDRLKQNEVTLREFYKVMLAGQGDQPFTPATEWLLDNYYLIEEQVQMARRHLPRGYSRELPRLVNGPAADLPRVYGIVLELLAHVDAQVDAESLSAFVSAYQTVVPLTLGELWAIPIMLRLGLIENLQRVATGLSIARDERKLATDWVDRLQATAEQNPSHLVIVVADMAKAKVPVSSPFVAEFIRRLSRKSPILHLARTWLDQRLVDHGTSSEQLVHLEGQHQASNQISVSHSITSLRFLIAMNWKKFVESLSEVESILRVDPANIYPRMDFATRDQYRHAVEAIARRCRQPESEVARIAVRLATAGGAIPGSAGHVGYYLVDRGRGDLERAVGVRRAWVRRLTRRLRHWSFPFYTSGILAISLTATGWFLWRFGFSALPRELVLPATALLFACASQPALALVNLASTLFIRPRLLPRLDFAEGLPLEDRTAVVIPTLLGSPGGVDQLIETLELHYLANQDEQVAFALLTDYPDAVTEHEPQDAVLLARARTGIVNLNRKYPAPRGSRFLLLHRPRRFNAAEGVWMGYERKRGKLMAFNKYLRGGAGGDFAEITGDPAALAKTRYVLTLDTDTQLPRDAVRRLVGTMAHPLNHPAFDPHTGIVTGGYAILQPRVAVSLPTARRSWFVRLMAADAGLDPYTREVSDVYQDLFRAGSFIGKGIYDVDAFERALEGRFPENRILSHDLLESCHARSGLLSDVQLFEDFPSRYLVDVARRHRWMRGDWQNTPWLSRRVPGGGSRGMSNPLSFLSQWKIFDNLRRSLIPPWTLALLAGGWFLAPALGAATSALVVGFLALPGLLAAILAVMRKADGVQWRVHLRYELRAAGGLLAQIALALAVLPFEALVSLDAVLRTVVRVRLTHRRLLEWKTAGEAERTARTGLAGCYATMWAAPAAAVLSGVLLRLVPTASLPAVVPFLVLWLAAPALTWWISRPIASPPPDLATAQITFLRRTARATWQYFETFVTAEEHWLPPDNFQEVPAPVVASRTSPTNMGLALLANLAARDLGYCSTGRLLRRTGDAFTTMHGLERHHGHFLNWYDTRTLQPLLPRYVSLVDSGNLAGHLLTLGAGLRELADAPVVAPQLAAGLRDTLHLLREATGDHPLLDEVSAELKTDPADLPSAIARLARTAALADRIAAALHTADGHPLPWAGELVRACADHLDDIRSLAPDDVARQLAVQDRMPTLRDLASFESTAVAARARLDEIERLAATCEELATMDFTFLYDKSRDLFTIGYNVTDRRADPGFYDLLASEARLGSYVAIAMGQIPQTSWFSLGRLLASPHGEPALVSWSGSMFEYLMPLLVMPNYDGTLLDQTCRAVVRRQIEYGRIRDVPWGVSESGFNRMDVQHNYQYRAFGVPGLGWKRGLADDLVVAPYATALALMVSPEAACRNLEQLARDGCTGHYGFYEAVDYTASRLPPDETRAIVRSFMTHHQGISLLALDNVLNGFPMQRRFMAYRPLKAAALLLQERVPRVAGSDFVEDEQFIESRTPSGLAGSALRVFTNPAPAAPDVHLLSNGRYHVAISSAGGGFSRWGEMAVTRWREDATLDGWGMFVYLRDVATDEVWSVTHQPTRRPVKRYETVFSEARAEFRLRHAGLDIHTAISVSPEDDVELRRITIANRQSVERVLELTSYAEVVLARQAADVAHPAYGNLFVETEFLAESSAILATRRPRSPQEASPWLLHTLVARGGVQGPVSCETDRATFVGRGRSLESPAAMRKAGPLSNTAGAVLDPVIAIRRTITVPPHATVVVDLAVGVAKLRSGALALVEKYLSERMVDRAFDLAWTHSQVTLHLIDATEAEAHLFGRIASGLIYADATRRAAPPVLRANRRGQSGLWSYGISGDVPLVLFRIADPEKIEYVRQLIKAHAYWRMKGLVVDLLILHEDVAVYRQPLHDRITSLITSGIEAPMLDKPGGIFVRRLPQVPHDDLLLLQAAARVILDDEKGTLAEQMERHGGLEPLIPRFVPTRSRGHEAETPLPPREITFANGYGGLTRDAHEYVITLHAGQMTPMPWVNVLANDGFGTVVSESGSAYTWSDNAHEFRLTPWSDDPVQDPTGEALYIRDDETGHTWSPTPLPTRGAGSYIVRHGFGYTVFEHQEAGLISELWIYVATDAPVKCSVLKLRNVSGRPRRLSLTAYCEWVLGEARHHTLLHVQTEVDLETGALFARNRYNTEFTDRVAFLDVNDPARSVTGDRREFIGRNGTLAAPAALRRARLSGAVGAGLDPCGAMQVTVALADGEAHETTFILGAARNRDEARTLVHRFRRGDESRSVLEAVWSFWNRTLGTINVDTPDPAVNAMANGWLLYQTLGSRLWGRTGFYQSGGAYGFRDQLQDVMALVHAEPRLVRAHLLRAASRQFREGDVQHWWHPPVGRGVRTHISDDFLWLPYAVCRYVAAVRDTGVLDESVRFLEGRAVKPDEEAYFDLPGVSEGSATLYDHCVRAIEHGLAFGAHGLPLMGRGDWNDGMNLVGAQGRGESVWLAFFLYDVLVQFAVVARSRQDDAFADRCAEQARVLKRSIEATAWDGDWYLRAWFDDGGPLGSRTNPECQIDSLPQSWSVISGAGDPARSRQAMQSVDERLVSRADRLIRLFTPAFDTSDLNPGYIKGYVPGVRENGGQYTHAAVWTVMAFALLGDHARAWELLGMLNPLTHGGTPDAIARYKVEPYVVASDVYAAAPHTGRGGWTWYTGSAGWMYRLLIETLLGINREGDFLRLAPRLPPDWPGCKIHYRYAETVYHITYTRAPGDSTETARLILDGNPLPDTRLPLVNDRKEHFAEMTLVSPSHPAAAIPPT